MPRVHFVKKARKDNPAVKKGEPYFWWKTRMTIGKSYVGRKHYSKSMPRPSQLTSSIFLSEVYAQQEAIQGLTLEGDTPADKMCDLESNVNDICSELENTQSEQQDKLDNMPDGLREGSTGELLQGRIDSVQEMIDALQAIDFDLDETDDEDGQEHQVENVLEEVQAVSYEGE